MIKKRLVSLLLVIVVLFSLELNTFAEDQYSGNCIPIMTGYDTPSGIVSADSNYGTEQVAWKAFDHNVTNYSFGWQSDTTPLPHWIMYEFDKAKKIVKYTMTASTNNNAKGAPLSWRFEGSNDGTNWSVLDTKLSQPVWDSLEKRSFTFENKTAYLKYRIVITEKYIYAYTASILELEMMESLSQIPNSPVVLPPVCGNSLITLSWTATTGSAITYNVKRSTVAAGPYETIAMTSETAYIDNNVVNGTTYYYVVSAEDTNGESENSNEVSATPVAPPITEGNKAILEITLDNGVEKEYNLTAAELQDFLTWYDGRSGGTGKAYYVFTKKVNINPFLSRKEYIAFDKIHSFEVKEYED